MATDLVLSNFIATIGVAPDFGCCLPVSVVQPYTYSLLLRTLPGRVCKCLEVSVVQPYTYSLLHQRAVTCQSAEGVGLPELDMG